ncbi:cytochrome o ubiquinol oxidase subunit III [Pseudomonas kermanshahensis]|jgi:cytochrome o ubiquinol oxidase subunit 3|uniref:Cytochrome bo(3) ubiquinol oxidase subunit 3 n=1 Tax=Pseudomonas kermanshahensis TaxID=2745482 RepID=A0ABU8RC38_9PSED|nr:MULTISPECIES: cytochrome o ubiquinol oxidase subunit III [Pseudomonas]ATP43318.1 cytochrome o ubiquinol oxidase subunit III [Pseudomonas putida]ATP48593.1 cytochrome o ubiquinol oxidase subunit III [Pseudomonas putida]MBC3484042.1 cytochrome o ubiquinol oxidase subunit III [Pseudomonas sp. SWRI50]MBC3497323.1 cytochrome o ubiquinol oxidase subunit III [Pseudomonas sp. SWRI67]MBV4524928.1 cytochrome o ubiquinol oxidase subunit III [Pseudomonas kermanshahensis]
MSSQVIHGAAHGHDHGHDDHHHDSGQMTVLGFWLYLMTDCILFASLFATYAVLSGSFAGGPSGHDIFQLDFVAVETAFLLLSSITFGFAMLKLFDGKKAGVLGWLAVTFLFGAGFIAMEIYEFHHLIAEGFGPQRSGFLSAFFALVGTHGLHVTAGLIWMAILMYQISTKGITPTAKTRMSCLSLFWHFLDVVWICVFTVVYLLGVL